jgi:glycosyltransferase involved in cell wall biosynthesis
MYLQRIRQLRLPKVSFVSLWLEPEDYPLILGSADLGVCLHTSSSGACLAAGVCCWSPQHARNRVTRPASSAGPAAVGCWRPSFVRAAVLADRCQRRVPPSTGLDLPMKVVDMFGAGLPVCAVDYACITELVQPGVSGLLFSDAQQLAAQLLQLLRGFDGSAGGSGQLAALRAGVAKEQSAWRWQDNWQAVAAPVFARCAAERSGGVGMKAAAVRRPGGAEKVA